MRIEIPGYKTMDLKYLILDYNGTIAKRWHNTRKCKGTAEKAEWNI